MSHGGAKTHPPEAPEIHVPGRVSGKSDSMREEAREAQGKPSARCQGVQVISVPFSKQQNSNHSANDVTFPLHPVSAWHCALHGWQR